jgi:hypothetical protein
MDSKQMELQPIEGLIGPLDLTDEAWREYDLGSRNYRIVGPVALYYRSGGSTHRVVDSDGVVHCVPFPGSSNEVILRWSNKPGFGPVKF